MRRSVCPAVALLVLAMTDPAATGQTADVIKESFTLKAADGRPTGYRRPPAPIDAILDAPAPPAVSLAPSRDRVALVTTARYPGIAELAGPVLRLAGLRINPVTNGPRLLPNAARPLDGRITGVTLVGLADRKEAVVAFGPDARPTHFAWAPDGRAFAALDAQPGGAVLLVGDATTGGLRPVPGVRVNFVFGGFDWADADTLLVWAVPPGRGPAPAPPAAPDGPVVQEGTGRAAPVRTYQDLLQNTHDEALFAHYATSQLALIDRATLAVTPVGPPGVVTSADLSPDGQYLLRTRVVPPFSYQLPCSGFPKVVEVLDRTGAVVHTVATLPDQSRVPIEGVPTGPRGVRWVPTAPSTLLFAKALDGGDPKAKVPHRDELFTHAAPFAGPPAGVARVQHRFTAAGFFASGEALVTDYDRDRRWTRSVKLDFAEPAAAPVTVFDRSAQDRYGDPGTPAAKTLPTGQTVLRTDPAGKLWLSSSGATPKGDVPFLAAYDPVTHEAKKVFSSRPGVYETASLLSDDGSRLLVRRESPAEPGNYYLRAGQTEVALTHTADPYPPLRAVKKRLVTTTRPDGVTISFTLYTPPGYVEGTRLPTVFWAYPKEFNTADTAGQVTGSTARFVTLSGYSHLFLLTQGYAVMDDVSVPIVGPPDAANDTFVEQLAASAKAAIDKAVELGPVDRDRIGCGGHSYGAFMAANLLAHTDYFKAGVARSGAYNRTLTPFGFQNERRTFWDAPDVYAKMSPFNNVPKIKAPLLLVHGQADSNPGTFPVQSERLYQALRGVGGTVRLVLLPHEDHGYAARESVGHVLAETVDWFDKYVK